MARPTAWIAGMLGALSLAGPAAAAEPVVVELFTSQGCSSCPPADALLGELAARPDVLALAFHVDYWDRLGWRDPYSARWATDRQRTYARLLGSTSIYTPQMVVDGRLDVVGSDGPAVADALRQPRSGATVPVTLERSGDSWIAGAAAGTGTGTLWLATLDRRHVTRIGAGENDGRVLTDSNVVRSFRKVADWTGGALRVPVPAADAAPGELVVALLQANDGHYLGAQLIAR